jgi:uncharacterized membrane protein
MIPPPPADKPPLPPPGPAWSTLKALVRTRVTAGVLTILPIVITIWLVQVVFTWLRDLSLGIINQFLPDTVLKGWGVDPKVFHEQGLTALPNHLQWGISIFAVLLTFVVLYIVGLFAANIIGKRLIEIMEWAVDRVPIVKTIYRALKQIIGLFQSSPQNYQRVALVPFPNEITRSVAFITSMFRDAITGDELVCCFIPTTPNPTTGFVFVLKRKDIVEVDWSAEEAIKIIMSGGILLANDVTMKPGAHLTPRIDPTPA